MKEVRVPAADKPNWANRADMANRADKPDRSDGSAVSSADDSTGVENVRYDVVTGAGAPDNPRNGAEMVSRGLVPATDSRAGEPEAQVRGAGSGDAEGAVRGFDEQIRLMRDAAARVAPEDEATRLKRERRERSHRIIGAVSDGLGALSNLWFTSRYSPNIYNERVSMSDGLQRHYDKLRAEREKNNDRYLQYSLKLGDSYNQRAKSLRELAAAQQAAALARQEEARKQEEHDWRREDRPDERREKVGKADKAEKEAKIAGAKLRYADDLAAAELATEKSKGRNYAAAAAAHNRSNVYEYSAEDEDGNVRWFKDRDAAIAYARQHGTLGSDVTTEKTKGTSAQGGFSVDYNKTKTTTVPYPKRTKKEDRKKGSGYENAKKIKYN